MLSGKGVQEELFEKSSFLRAIAGLSTTLAAGIADSSSEISLLAASKTKIVLEVTATFNAAATDGARIRIYEYFVSGSAATEPSNEGTVAISAGNTVRQTFHFEIRSPYYTVEVMNLDGAQDLTGISASVIEFNEPLGMQTPLESHMMYHDGTAWKRQGQITTETTLAEISDNIGDKTDAAAAGTGDANAIQLLKQAEINLTAIETAVETLDNIVSGTEAHVKEQEACSMHFDADGGNTAQVIKAAAGKLYALEISNPNAADAWIQLFDVAAGSVVVGTTTPNLSFLVPAGNGVDDGGMDKCFVIPANFTTAITYACTTTATGNGDPTTGLVVNALYV